MPEKHKKFALVAGLVLMLAATATTAATPALKTTLLQFLQQRTADTRGDVSISLDMPHAEHIRCRSPQPFLPTSDARLSGRVTVGVKCPGDRPSRHYFQADIAIRADYYVAAHAIAPGATVSPSDLRRVHGDITRLSAHIVRDPTRLLGQVTTRRIAKGIPITAQMVRHKLAIKRGENVRVIVKGQGFTITTSGQALNKAAAGQPVRVRTKNDATVTGTAQADKTVVVQP